MKQAFLLPLTHKRLSGGKVLQPSLLSITHEQIMRLMDYISYVCRKKPSYLHKQQSYLHLQLPNSGQAYLRHQHTPQLIVTQYFYLLIYFCLCYCLNLYKLGLPAILVSLCQHELCAQKLAIKNPDPRLFYLLLHRAVRDLSHTNRSVGQRRLGILLTVSTAKDGTRLPLVQSAQLYSCGSGHIPPQFPHTTQMMVSIAFVKHLMLSG